MFPLDLFLQCLMRTHYRLGKISTSIFPPEDTMYVGFFFFQQVLGLNIRCSIASSLTCNQPYLHYWRISISNFGVLTKYGIIWLLTPKLLNEIPQYWRYGYNYELAHLISIGQDLAQESTCWKQNKKNCIQHVQIHPREKWGLRFCLNCSVYLYIYI